MLDGYVLAVSLFVLLSMSLLTFLERCCVRYQNASTCAYTHKHADTLVTFSTFSQSSIKYVRSTHRLHRRSSLAARSCRRHHKQTHIPIFTLNTDKPFPSVCHPKAIRSYRPSCLLRVFGNTTNFTVPLDFLR